MEERSRVKNSIDQLQARGDLFTRKLIHEKQRIAASQIKLKQVNEQIVHLREANKKLAMGLLNKHTTTPNDAYHRVDGVNPTRLAEMNQKKIVKNLESRLGKALIRRNEIENENTNIKRKIDKLRRKILNDVKSRERIERELIEVQSDMDRIMERAAVASDERERLINERNEILAENSARQSAFEKEYNELVVFIAKQSKALGESIASAADNVVSMLSAADGYQGSTDAASGDDSITRKQLEEKLAALDKEYDDTQKALHDNECKIHAFEEQFQELRDVSGLSSTEDIISTFVKSEEECFSIFNYIQALNQDCDKTIEQANQLRADIDEYRHKEIEKERIRSTTVNVYKDNLEQFRAEREKMYQTAIECRRTVEVIAKKITALYFKLKCNEIERDEHALKDALPAKLRSDRKLTTISGGEVSEQNILNLMELIETRSIQIINTYLKSSTSSKKLSRRPSLFLVRFISYQDSFLLALARVLTQTFTSKDARYG
jgi:chromosome segregation ATPase